MRWHEFWAKQPSRILPRTKELSCEGMTMKKTVCVVTGTRAEWGLLRGVSKKDGTERDFAPQRGGHRCSSE